MATTRMFLTPEEALFRGTSGFPQYVKADGTDVPRTGLAFDATTAEAAHWKFPILGYGSGDVTVAVRWYADTASSGGVTFGAVLAAITPDADTQDAETDTYPTQSQASDTHLGTVGQRIHTFNVVITGAALDTVADGDEVVLKLSRLPADAADTMAGDCIVTDLVLSYSDT